MSKEYTIRVMTLEDYDEVYALWSNALCADRKEKDVLCVGAYDGDTLIGAILCGHDGRRGCLYHVCVHEDYRKNGIGKAMAVACMRALQKEKINKVSLIAFKSNELGNHFWKDAGWCFREDLNYYDFTLNEANITRFNQ